MKATAVAIFDLLKASYQGWSRDNASLYAAALTYYTFLSLAPVLVIIVAVAGLVYGDAAVRGDIVNEIQLAVGAEAALVIQELIVNASTSGSSVWATVLSTVLLLVGASGLFSQLQRTLNMIWGLHPAPETGLLNIIRKRALAFAMLLVAGLLMLLSIATTTLITTVGDRLAIWLPGFGQLLPQINIIASLIILTLLFALLFKVLPDAHITWKDVLLGAAVTTVLFMLGRFLINLYLSRSSTTSAYGAAGSFVLILLWVYYSAQIFFFGAEFTKVYANKYGTRLKPSSNAIWRSDYVNPNPPSAAEEIAYRINVSSLPDEPPPDAAEAETAVPHWRKPVATGLLGLAAGLLLGFLSSLRRGKEEVGSEE